MYLSQRAKVGSALAASAVVAGIAVLLVLGLRVAWAPHSAATLISIAFAPPEPRKPDAPPKAEASQSAETEGAPAPAGKRSQATAVTAPLPRIILQPPSIVVAVQPGEGSAATSGAAESGSGSGAGGSGDGNSGGGVAVEAEQVAGRLRFSDVSDAVLDPSQSAEVSVRYAVEVNGRVSGCVADRSSGNAALDALACRLIEKRFRFRPARDKAGRPVRSVIVETHGWTAEPPRGRR